MNLKIKKDAVTFFANFLNDETVNNNPVATAVPVFFAEKELNYNNNELKAAIVDLYVKLIKIYQNFTHMIHDTHSEKHFQPLFIKLLNKNNLSLVVV